MSGQPPSLLHQKLAETHLRLSTSSAAYTERALGTSWPSGAASGLKRLTEPSRRAGDELKDSVLALQRASHYAAEGAEAADNLLAQVKATKFPKEISRS